MPRFVVFLDNEGLQKSITSSAEAAGAIVFQSFHSKIIKNLFKLHNAWPLNRKHELPFKFIWFQRCFNEKSVPPDESITFVFYESFYLTYSQAYLKHLKEQFPTAKFCYVFLNPVNEQKLNKYNTVAQHYDAAVAVFSQDAEKYGFLLNEYYPFLPPELEKNCFPESDVFFVGVNKGRINRLIEIYEQLSSSGLRCDFHIVGVEDENQKYKNTITYNRPISYEEALQRLTKSKCVLEVLQDNSYYFSIRTIEAMHYHKKLLTTNKAIKHSDIYNPDVIQIFDTADSIDVDFIKNETSDDEFPPNTRWSFASFQEYLIKNL